MEENNNKEQQDIEKECNDQDNGGNEIKPTNVSRRGVYIILISLCFALIIFIALLKGCSVAPNGENAPVSESTNLSDLGEQSGVQIMDENGANNSENIGGNQGNGLVSGGETFNTENTNPNNENGNIVPETEEVAIESETESVTPESVIESREESKVESESSNSESESNNEENVGTASEGLGLVSEFPELGNEVETSGMVSGKNMYTFGESSYVYMVNFLLLNGEDGYFEVDYCCPKKTFDALNMGDTVIVTYQADESGRVSISSVSK